MLKGLTRRRAAEATLFAGAGCIAVDAREDGPMAQQVDAPTAPGLVETAVNSKIGRTGLGLGMADAAQTMDAVSDAAEKAQSAKDAAESLGVWDVATHALQSPRVLFGIAALIAIGLLIYWRHRDHS